MKIVKWEKNYFEVPKNATGKDFISELKKIFHLFNSKTILESVAINMAMVFLPLMLQKPSARSKKKDHTRYLKQRLETWRSGSISDIILECEAIQKRLKSSKKKSISDIKGFTRLMLEGKVRQALKLVNANSDVSGVHDLTPRVVEKLKEKHPDGQLAEPTALIEGTPPRVEPVIYEDIDSKMVQEAAKNTSGSGGPTKIDADIWKHLLCSKAFGKHSDELAEEIALTIRRLCTEQIPADDIEFLWASRLVPLMKKDDGVRPIGIGETLRRVMARCVLKVCGEEVQNQAGTLQTCAGMESGIEASIHAVADKFKEETSEGVLLVDAKNAFNLLNIKVAIHNVQHLCPPMYTFLNNSYHQHNKLFLKDGSVIMSKEGVTQGDPLSMAIYALSTRKLIETLREKAPVLQAWFAEDDTAVRSIANL